MKRKTLPILLFVLAINFTNAQTGINTTAPKATLDIAGNPTDATKLDGVIAPRLTGAQLRAKNYTADQTGALVYITTSDASPTGQTINVTTPGYYMFDGSVWKLMITAEKNIYNSDGSLTANRTVNVNNKLLKFTQGEIATDYINSYRLAQTQYGIFSRNDGTAYYLLPTAQNDPYGSFGAERPFSYFFGSKVTSLAQTAAENVGIGTNTATAKLHVVSGVDEISRLQKSGDNRFTALIRRDNGTFSIWNNKDGSVNGYTHGISIDNLGNVGMGTESPLAKLHVAGNVKVETLNTGAATDQIVTADADGFLNKRKIADVVGANSVNIYNSDGTLTGNRTVNQNGNNLTFKGGEIYAANTRLHQGGGIEVHETGTGDRYAYVDLHSDGDVNKDFSARLLRQPGANSNLILYNTGSGLIDINGALFATNVDKNVGIGTGNPAYKLDVNGDVINNGWYRSRGATGWYSETYNGGFYMSDTDWIRAYNSKSIWTEGKLGSNAGITVGYSGASPNTTGGAIIAGNVGIGTTNPVAKLDVSTSSAGAGFKLADTTQGDGKVLTSDANGNASWQLSKTSNVVGVFPDQNGNYPSKELNVNSSYYSRTSFSITLPPGQYQIFVNGTASLSANTSLPTPAGGYPQSGGVNTAPLNTNGLSFVLRAAFSDQYADTLPANQYGGMAGAIGAYGTKSLAFPIVMDQISYNIYINNNSGAPKTYYLYAKAATTANQGYNYYLFDVFNGRWAEDNITAIRIGN